MSKTVIECWDKPLLNGFRAGFEFGAGADGVSITDLDTTDGYCLLIEADDDFDNQTYTLKINGLFHKHTGVEL